MKIKNNIQKTVLKFTAIVASLILISFVLKAQDSFSELLAENSFGKIAGKFVVCQTDSKSNADIYSVVSDETDQVLVLSDWMIEFDSNAKFALTIANDVEAPLDLEQWMIQNEFYLLSEMKMSHDRKLVVRMQLVV